MERAGSTVEFSTGIKEPVPGSLFIRAFLEKDDGTPISAIDLVHTNNGRYRGSFTMPAFNVNIMFIVYSDAGYTTVDPLYDQDLILIELDTGSVGVVHGEILDGTVHDEVLVGFIEDAEVLSGVLEQTGLDGNFN